MSDTKVVEAGETTGHQLTQPVHNPWPDRGATVTLVIVFSFLAFINLVGIPQLFPVDSASKALSIAARIANVMFLSLIASTALTRLAPIRKAKGIEPRISALLGTFLCTGLAMLPRANLGPLLSSISTILILVGASLSFLVLRWLGKSFSIMAEARRLVVAGPYRFVRHPLYLCEGLAIVGVMLQVISPWAVLVGIAIALIQYRRMINEEAILRSAFPEYEAYAAGTPQIVPLRLVR